MKKLISLILAAVMLLSLCACAPVGSEGGSAAKGLQAGFGREKIMPADGKIGLSGYGNADTRISSGFLDYLYATCLALKDEADAKVLLFHLDIIITTEEVVEQGRIAVSEATGVPQENIYFAATHTHSAPGTEYDIPGIEAYKNLLYMQCATAAESAIADLSPAEMSMGSKELENMNFVRHYIQENGAYVGSNFGDYSASPIKDYATEGDHELQLLKFTRAAEDKKDIVMMNWNAHPCLTDGSGSGTNLSADFIGSCRAYVEEQVDCSFIYFTGAAGNQNTYSHIEADDNGLDYKGYGEALGNAMIEVLESMTPVASGTIKTTTLTYEAEINKEGVDRLEQAQEVVDLWHSADRTASDELAEQYGFGSTYHCNSIVKRAAMTGTTSMELNAVSVGGFSWINAPYEMFSGSSLSIKEQTPFDMTFIITCSGPYVGYIPTSDAYEYDHGCYESQTSTIPQGTAEILVEKYVSMLEQLHTAAE